jgi:hypothetical protein
MGVVRKQLGSMRLKTPRVLPYSFLAGVSGQGGKRRIYVLDSSLQVGDDDAIGCLLNGCNQAGTLDHAAVQTHNSPL